jgi:hypothetical protein
MITVITVHVDKDKKMSACFGPELQITTIIITVMANHG